MCIIKWEVHRPTRFFMVRSVDWRLLHNSTENSARTTVKNAHLFIEPRLHDTILGLNRWKFSHLITTQKMAWNILARSLRKAERTTRPPQQIVCAMLRFRRNHERYTWGLKNSSLVGWNNNRCSLLVCEASNKKLGHEQSSNYTVHG